jgi:hypothetical protein
VENSKKFNCWIEFSTRLQWPWKTSKLSLSCPNIWRESKLKTRERWRLRLKCSLINTNLGMYNCVLRKMFIFQRVKVLETTCWTSWPLLALPPTTCMTVSHSTFLLHVRQCIMTLNLGLPFLIFTLNTLRNVAIKYSGCFKAKTVLQFVVFSKNGYYLNSQPQVKKNRCLPRSFKAKLNKKYRSPGDFRRRAKE